MFVLNGKELTKLEPAEFTEERIFQELLEEHPELLGGELINPENPRRWLLISREIDIPGELNGPGVWSADHLFLDHEGIPTIVEVKRQTDTRLRREVVGQMLDYAANAVEYWSPELIRAKYETACRAKNVDPDEHLLLFLNGGLDAEMFWTSVKTNLEAQKLRLLFVADVIPRELRRVVEFLNQQMNPCEVLALELKQYAGADGIRTLAPTLFGQTEKARSMKGIGPGAAWTRERLFDELAATQDPATVATANFIADWIERKSDRVAFGSGRTYGSMTSCLVRRGLKYYPLTMNSEGKVWINFRDIKRPPFDVDSKRIEWMNLLNTVPGLSIAPEKYSTYGIFPIAQLNHASAMGKFAEVLDWFVAQVTASGGGGA